MDLTKYKQELLFLPLGGSGEIGMNLNLYHYDGKWLIVDMGAGFADDYLPGIDMIVPDISFLMQHKENIVGLVLTHAHEDHLGAVQYLYNKLECQIYTTPFTGSFLRAKLVEMHNPKPVKITELPCGSKFSLKPFDIEMVPLTHSTPEMHAIVVRTPVGNVLHTGDWKFDHDPLIGEANDEDLLKKYGDEGIIAMIGDSTNVFNPGKSGSEGDLRHSLTALILQCKKMVAVTTFASNVARIETIIKAAEVAGRRVVIAGRSLWRIIGAAQDSGYLNDVQPFLDEREIGKYPREKLLLICTGCQGEPLAAINKIAHNSHPFISLAPDDTVIFSSKIIPGNEKKIFRLFNQFVKIGVEVLTEKDHFVHVSGHPAKEELELMYRLVRPQLVIPVHGEAVHMHEHARLAAEWGVPNTIQLQNGDIVCITPGKIGHIGNVTHGYLAIDGKRLIPSNSSIIKDRRKMRDEGIIIITLIMEGGKQFATEPIVIAPGCLDVQHDGYIIEEIRNELVYEIEKYLHSVKHNKIASDQIINLAKSTTRRIIKSTIGRKPMIYVHIEKV
jgi:ribonuclease J